MPADERLCNHTKIGGLLMKVRHMVTSFIVAFVYVLLYNSIQREEQLC